jgi:BirA family biotin operon repressor/biotin-[acetyl-CoA-carboxylase] ligase
MGKYFLKYPQRNIRVARMLRKQMTDAERLLWSRIRQNQLGVHFRRQVPIGSYIVDFLSVGGRLAIELDGEQHYTENGKMQDKIRDDELRKYGLTVLRFDNFELLKSIDAVVSQISDVLESNAGSCPGEREAKVES